MPATTKGAWKLQEVRDALLNNEWATYDTSNDPGTLWAWGGNAVGELGQNDKTDRSSPVQIPGTNWLSISGGGDSRFLARKTDGTLWSWGMNSNGQLGDNTTTQRSSPIQVPGTSWSDIAAGYDFSLARKTDGTLWGMGCNACGRVGNNINQPTGGISSPVQIPGTTWNDIAAGTNHSLARKTDGTLWSWGYRKCGQLGNNYSSITGGESSPVQIPGTSWNDISASCSFSLARKTDGTLWAWGFGLSGNLGDGAAINRSSPVQIPGTNWNDITSATYFTLARKTDGTLWTWGTAASGQLGNQDPFTNRSSPIQVPGTSWSDIAANNSLFSLARKTDCTLWVWGCNGNGQLGDNTTTQRSSPVQIPGTTWNDIASGAYKSTLARKLS